MSSEWDVGQVVYSGIRGTEGDSIFEEEDEFATLSSKEAHCRFREFLKNFRLKEGSASFIYRDQLSNHFLKGLFFYSSLYC